MNTHIVKTKYWTALADGRVQCDLCPRHCQLRDGKRGVCYIRQNIKGEIVLTSYGLSSGFCIDPIEKKPLNHFYPGSSVMSFGTAGCNLSCEFCQNWNISKAREMNAMAQAASAEDIALAAKNHQCKSVAFTYNDPVIFMEYAMDVADACHRHKVKTVAVTAGYICDEPRVEFFSKMDAANVDLKGFTEAFYKKRCHGHLQAILDTLIYIKHHSQVWLEITNLLIPGENDSDEELHQMCQWLVEHLGNKVPLHFSAFHPDYKMLNTPSTPKSSLLRARQIALSYGMKYVYCGNVHDEASDSTYCPNCKRCVIQRDWYELGQYHLSDTGLCQFCQHPLDGHFEHFDQTKGARRIAVTIPRL